MTGKIYLIQENGTLQPLSEQPYASEDLLQGLLGQYPDLLAGDQIDGNSPRRWLLVSREVGVPIEEDGTDLFSLDHLFLDQDAKPTLVEVKRSADPRIRREVVGQMLDYAANAVAYWSVDSLRARFEAACEGEGSDPIQVVAEFLQAGPEDQETVDGFWRQVKTNLQAGNIRLLFVADEIPRELRRIVEFLNRFMDPVEVLAVEIHQYVGQGLKTLVPRVIGQTAETEGKKSGTLPARQWDESSFLREVQRRHGAGPEAVAREILQWAKTHMPSIWWGKGKRSGSFIPGLDYNGLWYQVIAVWTYGSVEMQFQHMQSKPPFDDETKRLDLLRRMNAIPGIDISEDEVSRRPSIPLAVFQDQAVLTQFLQTLEWFTQEVKST